MSWMQRMIMGGLILRAPEGDGGGGGGGGTGGSGGAPDAAALAKENADLKAKLADLEKKNAGGGQGGGGGSGGGDDLAAKAEKERLENERKANHEKSLESAIKFTSQSKDWVKNNASLLPKNFESIIDQAEKENYGSAIEKANAVKAAFILEFFGQQANLDQLTVSQKVALEDFKKLAKDKRHEQAQHVFDSILEPTLEGLKKVRRAEQVGKGFRDQSTGEQAYRDRRIKEARKQFLANVSKETSPVF